MRLRLGRRLVESTTDYDLHPSQMATTAERGSLVVSSNLTSNMKSLLKKSEFPHVCILQYYVKNLKNASGSPEIGIVTGGASCRKIRSVLAGGGVMRLSVGRRLVDLIPLAHNGLRPSQ